MPTAIVREARTEGSEALLLRVAGDPEYRAKIYDALGTFCHQCRNQLNTLKLSFYLAGRSGAPGDPEAWSEQQRRYHEVEQIFDRLQQICRPMTLSPVRVPISLLWDEVFLSWTDQLRARGILFQTVPPSTPVVGDFDPTRLRPALDAFVDWRARVGRSGQIVTFSWSATEAAFLLDWSESAAVAHEGDADFPVRATECFALPYLARVLAAHGGTLECESRSRFRVRMRWPLEIHVHE